MQEPRDSFPNLQNLMRTCLIRPVKIAYLTSERIQIIWGEGQFQCNHHAVELAFEDRERDA